MTSANVNTVPLMCGDIALRYSIISVWQPLLMIGYDYGPQSLIINTPPLNINSEVVINLIFNGERV